jgi:hypothetical protein
MGVKLACRLSKSLFVMQESTNHLNLFAIRQSISDLDIIVRDSVWLSLQFCPLSGDVLQRVKSTKTTGLHPPAVQLSRSNS